MFMEKDVRYKFRADEDLLYKYHVIFVCDE